MTTLPLSPVSVRDPSDAILADAARLVKIVSEVTGLSATESIRKLLAENARLGETVRNELKDRCIAPYEWSTKLVDFYATTDAFIFESVVWNRSSLKRQLRHRIGDYLASQFNRPVRVLVFGDGPGFESVYFAAAGHEVSYFEVSQKAIRFAQKLFAATGSDVCILTDLSQIGDKRYDAIVCLDVLEHVPDPPNTVRSISAALAPHGCLIVHAPFWYLAPSVGTHLARNRQFSGDLGRLYRPHGLMPVDASWFWDPIVLSRNPTNFPQSLSARLRIFLGGLLLSVGRHWSWPHITIGNWLLSRGRDRWPAMEQLANNQNSGISSVTGSDSIEH